MGAPLSTDDLLRARWHATGLPVAGEPGPATPSAATPAAEVQRLGAVQAQDLEPTLWSVGRRTGSGREEVLAALSSGAVVRTHTLRPTWHLVHPTDLTLLQSATAPRVRTAMASLYRQEGLDTETLAAAQRTIAAHLERGPATRTELGAALAAAGMRLGGLPLGLVMMWAELDCLVASGPPDGARQTYALWPNRSLPPRVDAIRTLVERFLRSHGPATVADVSGWSSLTRAEVRTAVADLPVERAVVDGVEWLWLGDLVTAPWGSPQVELLNGYDEAISGLSPAGKRLLDPDQLARPRPGTPVGVLAVDGRLAGNWRRRTAGTEVTVEVGTLRPLTGGEREALDRHVELLAAFLDRPVRAAFTE